MSGCMNRFGLEKRGRVFRQVGSTMSMGGTSVEVKEEGQLANERCQLTYQDSPAFCGNQRTGMILTIHLYADSEQS